LGLRFHKKTGDLYVADAYLGILKVGPHGGLAEPVVTELDGVPLKFCNDLDFDDNGNLFSQIAAPSTSAGGLHLLYCPLLCPIAKGVLLRRHDPLHKNILHWISCACVRF
jgi:hypothetical protein